MIRRIRYVLGALETLVYLALAWVLVFVVPYRKTSAWFGGTVAARDTDMPSQGDLRRAFVLCHRLMRLARLVPWRTTCLVQAIAGHMLLKRRRIASTVRIGVTTAQNAVHAHAWLMVDGRIVLGGREAPEFVPLADMGA